MIVRIVFNTNIYVLFVSFFIISRVYIGKTFLFDFMDNTTLKAIDKNNAKKKRFNSIICFETRHVESGHGESHHNKPNS